MLPKPATEAEHGSQLVVGPLEGPIPRGQGRSAQIQNALPHGGRRILLFDVIVPLFTEFVFKSCRFEWYVKIVVVITL